MISGTVLGIPSSTRLNIEYLRALLVRSKVCAELKGRLWDPRGSMRRKALSLLVSTLGTPGFIHDSLSTQLIQTGPPLLPLS